MPTEILPLRDGPAPFSRQRTSRAAEDSWLRRLEALLVVIAVVCLGYAAFTWGQSRMYQAYENQQLDAILQSAPKQQSDAPSTSTLARVRQPAPNEVLGRIEVPRLGIKAIVRHGSDAKTLDLAVGHIPGTALPGSLGNMGLAAHRDSFFRRLGDIRPDDRIRVVTPSGTFTYRVQRTDVVKPKDVWVLNPTPTSVLTLVTCYPFSYVGAAPERFIVRAELETPVVAAAARPPQ